MGAGAGLGHARPLRLVPVGGSTPKTTFAMLASDAFRSRFPWDRTHLFFGDERFVPHDHPDSNYRMAREAMISKVPIPDAQVHPWETDSDPEHSALHYADTLKRFYGADTLEPARPLFDVTFLGLARTATPPRSSLASLLYRSVPRGRRR